MFSSRDILIPPYHCDEEINEHSYTYSDLESRSQVPAMPQLGVDVETHTIVPRKPRSLAPLSPSSPAPASSISDVNPKGSSKEPQRGLLVSLTSQLTLSCYVWHQSAPMRNSPGTPDTPGTTWQGGAECKSINIEHTLYMYQAHPLGQATLR